jgi:arylsulfatase A-like enzyme
MSGLRPFTTGVYENNNDWRTVIPEEQTLTHVFRQGGYYVCGAGKIYHEAYPRRSDWDDYLVKEGSGKGPTKLSPKAINDGVGGIKFAPLDCADSDLPDWNITNYGIEELGKPHDKPLFLAVGLHKPHMPWNVPQKYYDMFPLETIQLPPYLINDLDDVPPAGVQMAKPWGDHANIIKANRWKDAIQGYLAAIAYTDMNIGRLLDAFDKSAYKDNTIIVFWCDHGWHLGEKDHWRKFALWEEATRSPFIIAAPGVTKPGAFCERTVDFMSIFPTLCDLCGLQTPSHVQGRSIVSLLKDPKAPWDQPAVTTYKFKNHTVRTEGWRLIRYENGDQELYNEDIDPNEWKNLAKDADAAALARINELAQYLPKENHADIGGAVGKGAEDFGDGKKAEKKRLKKAAAAEAAEKEKTPAKTEDAGK